MKTNPFHRFNQPEVISGIRVELLHEFLHHFDDDFKARQIPLPSLTLAEADYHTSVSALLANPAALPDAMVEAILAIEEMAAPEQAQRREAAFWESPPQVFIDRTSSPENVALHLWLWSPYQLGQTAASSAAPGSPALSAASPPASADAAIEEATNPSEPVAHRTESHGTDGVSAQPSSTLAPSVASAPTP